MPAVKDGDGLEISTQRSKELETVVIDSPLSIDQVFLLFKYFEVLLPGDSADRNLAFIINLPIFGMFTPKIPFTRFFTSYTKPYRGPGASQCGV